MKLSHPTAIKLVSLVAGGLLRLWLGTLDFRFAADDERGLPPRRSTPGIYVFWHETILFPAYTHAREGFAPLISQHRDGELIAQIFRMLGGQSIRGSTTRGAVGALRKMIRNRRRIHLAVTPDGPRGPRRRVQIGAVYLASRTDMPLVPVGLAFQHPWRAPSWDRTALPKPFTAARGVLGRLIYVPAGLGEAELEAYRLHLQRALEDVQDRAQALADAPGTGEPLLPLRDLRIDRD